MSAHLGHTLNHPKDPHQQEAEDALKAGAAIALPGVVPHSATAMGYSCKDKMATPEIMAICPDPRVPFEQRIFDNHKGEAIPEFPDKKSYHTAFKKVMEQVSSLFAAPMTLQTFFPWMQKGAPVDDKKEDPKEHASKTTKGGEKNSALSRSSKDVLISTVIETEEMAPQTAEPAPDHNEAATLPQAATQAAATGGPAKKHKTTDELMEELSERIGEEMAKGDKGDLAWIDSLLRILGAGMLHRSGQLEHEYVRESMIVVREKAFAIRDNHQSIFAAVLQIGGSAVTLVGGVLGGIAGPVFLLNGAKELPSLLKSIVDGSSHIGQGVGGFSQVVNNFQEGDRAVLNTSKSENEENRSTRNSQERRDNEMSAQWRQAAEAALNSRHKAASEMMSNSG